MDLEYGPQYDDFRAEVISFIKENENTKISGPPRSESRIAWQQKLIDNGYFARSIPKEYGGYGGDMVIIKLMIIYLKSDQLGSVIIIIYKINFV